jgi:hypothetical protein
VPFWFILIALVAPQAPSLGQIVNTALVAVFSGVIATSLFLMARHWANKSSELAAVDATQSSEVVFAMAGEIVILNAPLPDMVSLVGIFLVFLGLMLFIGFQEK